MSPRTVEDLELLRSAAAEVEERARPKKGGRYVEHAYPGGPSRKPKVPGAMFGPRRFREYDGLSDAPAPGPKGPPAKDLIAEAAARRKAERERGGRG